MKQLCRSLLFVLISSILVFGCQTEQTQTQNNPQTQTKKEKEYEKLRKIAWDSLTQEEKSDVIGNWKNGDVTKSYIDKRRFSVVDPNFATRDFYNVSFHTHSEKQSSLNLIMVLIDKQTKEVVGYSMRGE